MPKVLHKICGKPLLAYVLDIVHSLCSLKTYVVTGYGSQAVKEAVGDGFEYVCQEKLLGTGDAVMRCASHFKNYHGNVLVTFLGKEIQVCLANLGNFHGNNYRIGTSLGQTLG